MLVLKPNLNFTELLPDSASSGEEASQPAHIRTGDFTLSKGVEAFDGAPKYDATGASEVGSGLGIDTVKGTSGGGLVTSCTGDGT